MGRKSPMTPLCSGWTTCSGKPRRTPSQASRYKIHPAALWYRIHVNMWSRDDSWSALPAGWIHKQQLASAGPHRRHPARLDSLRFTQDWRSYWWRETQQRKVGPYDQVYQPLWLCQSFIRAVQCLCDEGIIRSDVSRHKSHSSTQIACSDQICVEMSTRRSTWTLSFESHGQECDKIVFLCLYITANIRSEPK